MIRRFLAICLTALFTLPVAAQSASEGEKILQQAIPQCYDAKISRSGYAGNLPPGFTAESISLQSDDPYCRFDGALVHISDGRWYIGSPWPIGKGKGTPAEKLKAFVWERMRETFLPEVVGQDGPLDKLVVRHVTEAGRVEMEGYVDRGGIVFLLGDVSATAAGMKKLRDDRLALLIPKAPSKGPENAAINIVEFSDFQCPSCRHAHEYLPGLLAPYEGKVRYTRLDLPLVGSHPWAFAAAVIGRAIHQQKPDAFWQWKDAVYASQSDLNAFTIDKFGHDFAEDHGLDIARYEQAVASEALRKEILDSVGTASTIHVSGTPTYLVNGRFVASGKDGKNLERYLAELAAK